MNTDQDTLYNLFVVTVTALFIVIIVTIIATSAAHLLVMLPPLHVLICASLIMLFCCKSVFAIRDATPVSQIVSDKLIR